jgi:hypothetical protein
MEGRIRWDPFLRAARGRVVNETRGAGWGDSRPTPPRHKVLRGQPRGQQPRAPWAGAAVLHKCISGVHERRAADKPRHELLCCRGAPTQKNKSGKELGR